jgi:hypothetical protein
MDNSPSSRSSIAFRIFGVNLFMAADRIRFCSLFKKTPSGLGRESCISGPRVVSSFPPKSSIDTSRRPWLLRRNISASLMAIRVNQVEKEDFPSNLCKWTKAFWKLCCRVFPDTGETSRKGENPSLVTLDENVECVCVSTFGGKDKRLFFVLARKAFLEALRYGLGREFRFRHRQSGSEFRVRKQN